MSVIGQGLSGFREETPDNLILDAGVAYRGIDEDALKASGVAGTQLTAALENALKLGATRGGTAFDSGKAMREVVADGIRYPIAGFARMEGGAPMLTTNLLEQTQNNIELALAPTTTTEHDNWNEIQGKLEVDADTDYVDNVAIMATLSGSEMPVIIVLRNVICKSNPKFDLKDKNELGTEVVLTAHALASAPYDCPYSVYYPTTGNIS